MHAQLSLVQSSLKEHFFSSLHTFSNLLQIGRSSPISSINHPHSATLVSGSSSVMQRERTYVWLQHRLANTSQQGISNGWAVVDCAVYLHKYTYLQYFPMVLYEKVLSYKRTMKSSITVMSLVEICSSLDSLIRFLSPLERLSMSSMRWLVTLQKLQYGITSS